MKYDLPPMPDFPALDAAAPASADDRTRLLALIGNLIFSWSNNESLLIYVMMVLLRTDQISAATVFATLNTTRARLDLIQRLNKIHIRDKTLARSLVRIVERFNECSRVRNEFNHCMYVLDSAGEITHTQSMRIVETRNGLQFGDTRPVDAARFRELVRTTQSLKRINRDIWAILPRLQEHMRRGHPE